MITWEQGQELAQEFGLKFMETSAMNNENVDDAFLTLARDVKARLIDTAEMEKEKTKSVSLKTKQYDRFVSGNCCFGGGSSAESATKQVKTKPVKVPNSPARSVKSQEADQ
mgnify:CR=1 FL=1